MENTPRVLAPDQMLLRRLLPGVILGFLVFLGLAILGDLRHVGNMMLSFNWLFFFFAILLTLVNYTLRFFKWHFYLDQIGIHSLTLKQSARLFVAGFPLAVTPGKVGEVLKGVWLNQKTRIPVGRGISVVLAERISDGLAVLLLSTLGVIAFPQYWLVFTLVFTFLMVLIVLSQIRPVALAVFNWLERFPYLKKVIPGVREFYDGSSMLFRPFPLLMAVSLGVISWLGEGVGLYLILIGLGLTPSLPLAAFAVFVLSFSTVIGAASALPGGLGAAEVSIAGMITLLLHQDPAIASAATLLIRLATLWFGVGLGLLVWSFSKDLLGLQGHNDNNPAR